MMMARLSLSANGGLLDAPAWCRRRRSPNRSGPARPAARCRISRARGGVGQQIDNRRGHRGVGRLGRHVARGRAARLAAIGVSSSTGGTPAARASSGVKPKPSYSDRNANTDARCIERRQGRVVHIRADVNAIGMRALLANARRGRAGAARPVFADDLEPRARHASGDLVEGFDQSVDAASLENRTDVRARAARVGRPGSP